MRITGLRVHQQVLPDERAHRRHDEEGRDDHQPQNVLTEHLLIHQQRHEHAADNADDEHRGDKDQRVAERAGEVGIGKEMRVVLKADESHIRRIEQAVMQQ
jgi:hypothetical protein